MQLVLEQRVLRAPILRSLAQRVLRALNLQLLAQLHHEEREALEAMLDAAANKLLHPTIARLKRAAAAEGESALLDAANELLLDEAPATEGAPGLRVVRGG